jgi:hypothetical protein
LSIRDFIKFSLPKILSVVYNTNHGRGGKVKGKLGTPYYFSSVLIINVLKIEKYPLVNQKSQEMT